MSDILEVAQRTCGFWALPIHEQEPGSRKSMGHLDLSLPESYTELLKGE